MRREAIIKVVGVGGAGCNAVEHMICEGVTGVEFMCFDSGNTQELEQSTAGFKLQCLGLFMAYNRDVSMRKFASGEREYVADKLRGADMVFVVAGMGGCTGTSGAPVVAEIAREVGTVPVAVVTKPFESESERLQFAEEGITKLAQYVDSPIVLSNDSLKEELGEHASVPETYQQADNMLKNVVGGITHMINVPGMVGMDFADVRTVMIEKGGGAMGSSTVAGVDRARIASEQAVRSSLLGCADLSRASGVLVNVTASDSLELDEVYEVMNAVRAFARKDATVVFGTANDEGMADGLRVTVIATGIGSPVKRVDLSNFQPKDDDIPTFLRRI